MTWLAVFTATVIADFLWARWSIACTDTRPIAASIYSSMIVLCSGFTMIEFTRDPWLLIPSALGAAIGTWVAVFKRP